MKLWKILFLMLTAAPLYAQEVAALKDGRRVLLKPDGTWVYLREEPQAGASPKKDDPAAAVPGKKDVTMKDAAAATGGKSTGGTTATGLPIYEGPRGGRYHISKSGKKVYEKRRR